MMGDQWEWEGEQPSHSPPNGPFPSAAAQQAVASLLASFNSLHDSDTQSIFPWTRLHLQQEEEGTRCPRTTIKSSTTPFTRRWCKMNPVTRLQALHCIPAASTCCPELNPSLSPPQIQELRGSTEHGNIQTFCRQNKNNGFCFNVFLNKKQPSLCFFV